MEFLYDFIVLYCLIGEWLILPVGRTDYEFDLSANLILFGDNFEDIFIVDDGDGDLGLTDGLAAGWRKEITAFSGFADNAFLFVIFFVIVTYGFDCFLVILGEITAWIFKFEMIRICDTYFCSAFFLRKFGGFDTCF